MKYFLKKHYYFWYNCLRVLEAGRIEEEWLSLFPKFLGQKIHYSPWTSSLFLWKGTVRFPPILQKHIGAKIDPHFVNSGKGSRKSTQSSTRKWTYQVYRPSYGTSTVVLYFTRPDSIRCPFVNLITDEYECCQSRCLSRLLACECVCNPRNNLVVNVLSVWTQRYFTKLRVIVCKNQKSKETRWHIYCWTWIDIDSWVPRDPVTRIAISRLRGRTM